MNKSGVHTLGRLALLIAGFELVFWLLYFGLFWMMDGYSESANDLLAYKFESKLKLLWAILPIAGVYLWLAFWKASRYDSLANQRILSFMIQQKSIWQQFYSYVLFRCLFVFCVFALAQPVFGSKRVSATRESMELVFAVDVSSSMNTMDLEPGTSRLEVVKRAMNELLNKLHGERVGITIFAGNAYLQLPLTADYDAAKMFIQEVETDMISNQGTNIPAVLELSSTMFSKEKTGKAVLLLTDGENHEEGIEEAAKLIIEKEISLAVLGVGTESGGLIPNDPKRPELGYKTDSKGSTIVSKPSPSYLRSVASACRGISFFSSDAYPDLNAILDHLKHMKRAKVAGIKMDIKENWYQIPLVFALICLILYTIGFKKARKS